MEENTKENSKKIKDMEKENSNGKMEEFTKANGLMENNME